jgi:hypothetical protein
MPSTNNLQIPYPEEKSTSYYNVFVAMMSAIDSLFSSLMDERRLILANPVSDFSLALGTNTFTWSNPIQIIVPTTGVVATVAVGGIVLEEGETLYVNIPHPLLASAAITVGKASSVSFSRTKFPLCSRLNGIVCFYNGLRVIGA